MGISQEKKKDHFSPVHSVWHYACALSGLGVPIAQLAQEDNAS
jgi:hypothetical protein